MYNKAETQSTARNGAVIPHCREEPEYRGEDALLTTSTVQNQHQKPHAVAEDSPPSPKAGDVRAEYRKLPAVDALLRTPHMAQLAAEYGDERVTAAIRTELDAARAAIARGASAPPQSEWTVRIEDALRAANRPSLRTVINATGVIIHTNLGRAPLSDAARAAISAVAHTYNNLEYDLASGQRGSRYDHARTVLCELTGAEDALVVNNCASAVYLTLSALCQGRDVLISRSQLVEIGGGFRIPDVLRQSGARLVEVGATNRTHARDFTDAITPQTAAIMRVHASNFRQIGFVTMPTLADLAAIAHAPRQQNEHGDVQDAQSATKPLLLIDDVGSGSLLDTRPFGLEAEPLVQESIATGADLVTFSGDKLLGGPQAGIIVGRAEPIARLRRHPLARALRVDKMTLAALDATLRSYQRGRALSEIPIWRMISTARQTLHQTAQRWRAILHDAGIDAAVWEGESAVGGGSLPGETLPTALLALPTPAPDALAARLRAGDPPIVCRIQQDHLLCDPRTVLPAQEDPLLQALRKLFGAP